MEKLIAEIDRLDREIREAEQHVAALNEHRSRLFNKVVSTVSEGGTTGDRIRDMVVRIHTSFDPAMEDRLRKLEARLAGHAGELVMFSFALRKCTRHVFIPTPGFDNVYEEFWYVACGMLTDDKLRLQISSDGMYIVLPIDTYAWGGPDRRAGFKRSPSPFKQWDRVSPDIDMYADAPTDYVRERPFLCIGDDAVKTYCETWRKPEDFAQCCEAVGKLVLTPE